MDAPPAWSVPEGVCQARRLFQRAFDAPPAGVWAAPGRVNLIGEHTDYNAGLCLPVALPHRTFAAVAPRPDGRVGIVSALPGEPGDPVRWEGDLEVVRPGGVTGWVAYAAGPAWALREAGLPVPGFDAALVSDVPTGAGLSSSAAVGCAMGLALAELAGGPVAVDRDLIVAACVRAENEVAGAPTGGMDQSASLHCEAGHALLLDCRDGHLTQVPFDLAGAGLALLVVDTRTRHALSDGSYRQRRESCEEGARRLGVATLREVPADASLASLTALAGLDEVTARRVRHVVSEIARVEAFVAAVRGGDYRRAGDLMNASHWSLRDDYQVSCAELDTVVDAAVDAGALGARMTGGGFGGSAIALAPVERATDIAAAIARASRGRGHPEPVIHQVTPAGSGGRVD